MDYLIGNVAPAYKPEARLTRFLRHLIYLRPDTWIIVDELAAAIPSIFELWFHADAHSVERRERPFLPVADQTWETAAPKGRCRITSLAPIDITADPGIQRIEGIGAHADRDVDVLRLRNSQPLSAAVFVTVLDALGSKQQRLLPKIVNKAGAMMLKISTPGKQWTIQLQPGRKNPADSILKERRSRRTAASS